MNATANFPQHVAIIMDGNGRWAKEKGFLRVRGHQKGVDTIREIVRAARERNIQYLTLYAFSKENWARPKRETDFLMNLLADYLDSELEEMQSNGIRFNAIGRIGELPKEIQDKIHRNMERTSQNKSLLLSLALSYSSRVEITDAARRLCEQVKEGRLQPEAVSEGLLEAQLYTAGIPDPDLLIRTSGELRVSNFLLWQISYTEIYVSEKFWPDFGKEDFFEAIREYQKRDRRFGRSDVNEVSK